MFLIDPSSPWATAVPALVRQRIKADLDRRDHDALQRALAQAEEAQRAAEKEDDAMIVTLNARRTAEGKAPLTEQQEASVRGTRRSRRAPRP